MSNVQKLPAALVGAAAAESALTAIAHWPAWALLGCVPLAATAMQAKRTCSVWRTILAGLVATVLVGLAWSAQVVLGRSGPSGRTTALRRPPPASRPPWSITHTGRYEIREMVSNEEGDLWGVQDAGALAEFDGVSLSPFGVPMRFGGRIEHVIACAGRLLVTYGRGQIAEVVSAYPSVLRRLTYGDPIDAGALTGTMACGGGSVFVAMPLEAEVVRISVPEMQIVATIQVGKFVSGLAYSAGVLYVADATQAAVITVDLTTDLPWRWTVTTAAPTQVIGLRGEGTLLVHHDSQCLGFVQAGAPREVGERWSPGSEVRAVGIGSRHGVLLDSDGELYRFDADTGEQDATPIRVPLAQEATSIVVTPGDTAVLSIPVRRLVLTIPPTAWPGLASQPGPASGCLPAAQ
jgi:hypothetical protein